MRELRRDRLRPRRPRPGRVTSRIDPTLPAPGRGRPPDRRRDARRSEKLGWEPQTSFEELVRLMVDADLELLAERRAPEASGLTMAVAPEECDLAVVGGGILGLAVARELNRRRPGLSAVGARGGPGGGRRADRRQQRRDPRRHLLRARVAEGAAVRGGRARDVRVLRRARDSLRALRQGDRGPRRERAAGAGRAGAARTGERGARPAAPVGGGARARSSRTAAGSRRCTRRPRASSTSPRWRGRWPPISRRPACRSP